MRDVGGTSVWIRVARVSKLSLRHLGTLVNFIAHSGRKSDPYDEERGTIMSESRLQHIPFFEALSRAKEGSPDWRLTSAGLVTLRLFDAWLVEGPSVVSTGAWGLRAVREAIDAIEAGSSSKAILASIVDAMESAGMVRVPLVAPRLLAFARALQFDGRWELAVDVHQTVIAHTHPVEEADIVIAANMQLGACLRTLAQWDEATAAFARAGYAAAMASDIVGVLRARIAEAKVAIQRGNLPYAQALLEDTAREADANRLREVRSMALHDRADIAVRRGEYDLAVTLGYEALEGYTDPVSRDRVLGDIAAAFFELGLRTAARDAYLILAATAQEQHTRWVATINLMECAAADGREPIFEQYRRELADASLPATLACHYQFYVGEGYRTFGNVPAARVALRRALELAERHGLSQMVFRAEQSLNSLDKGVVIIAAAPAPTPDVERVADAVRTMRELAGVAG
jgi:tetratricopeptide (TPR) repeat protein